MRAEIGHFLTVFMGFCAIMNPLANTPVFLGLTADDARDVGRQVARQSLLWTSLLVLAFCLLGKLIFEMFGITLPAFRIAGGLLVALIGYQMLHGNQSSVHQPSHSDRMASREAQLSLAVAMAR